MEKMAINQLPSRTWNRLGVNEAVIDWDESATVVLPEESAEKADMLIASDAAYARKRVTVQAEKGAKKLLFQTLRTAGKLHVQTELTAEDGAEMELIQLVAPGENALVYDEVIGHCHGSGRIVLRQVTLGHGDVYAQTGIGLDGENASFAANIGYLARKNQTLDMNLVVNHWGKKTKCEINASGALNDAAKKIFRGTIDFKRGSSGSVGSEQETVLMLGEDAVNKTVPVILCAEENVEGTHGATIGEMDDDTRFYFGSRGIDRETAEKLLSRAAIARVAQQVKSETARAAILNELDGEMELLDFKTGKAIYDEHFVQLAAYRKLAEENGFPVKRCRILRVGRDETEGFEERVVTDTEKYFRVFQNLLEIYYLKKELRWN